MNADFFAVAPSGVIYLAHVATNRGLLAGMVYAITRGYTGFEGHHDAVLVQEQLPVLRALFEANAHRVTRMYDPEISVTVNVE